METTGEYIISGGIEGKNRLNVLAAILEGPTKSLLVANGVTNSWSFLDVGCGGGNVSLMAAALVGKTGKVTAIDFDSDIIALDQQDADAMGVKNVTYHAMDASEIDYKNEFDTAYSRFLLSHLRNPAKVLENMVKSVKPGGKIIVEDIDFSGHFCHPPSHAFNEYVRLFTEAGKLRGQNPDIGPSLVSLFREAGIKDVNFDVIQPAFSNGEGKWMAYITMDKIRDAILAQGLADIQAITGILDELETFTKDENTIISLPRIFRVWGKKG